MIQCIKCGMQNADGSKFCRFCGVVLMQSSSGARTPYSWQSEEFKAGDRTQGHDPRHTRVMSPPPPAPQTVQPMGGSPYQPQGQYQAQGPYQPQGLYQHPGQQSMQANAYGHMYCPNCRVQVIPNLERKISQAGWIVFAVLLIGFLPLFWIGLLIREDQRFCPVCRTRVG